MDDWLRRLVAVARAEALNLLRQPRALVVCATEPLVLLVLFGYCITLSVERTPFAVWDQDGSESSRQLVRELEAGGAHRPFELVGYLPDEHTVERALREGWCRFVLVIPTDYGRDLKQGRPAAAQAIFDGMDPNTAGLSALYLADAIERFNLQEGTRARLRGGTYHPAATRGLPTLSAREDMIENVDLRWRLLYNPDLKSYPFVVPGLIAILLTLLATTLTSTTLARERETGSLEGLLVLPVLAGEILLGKALPYLCIATAHVVLVLVLGGLVFGVWPAGSLPTLIGFTLLFLPAMLFLGLMLSALAPTQQFAALLALYSTLLPTFFLTGFALPRANMPMVLQWMSWPLPATQFLLALRGIYLRGVGWEVLWPQAAWLLGNTVLFGALALVVLQLRLKRGLE